MSGRLNFSPGFMKEDFYRFYRKERKGYAKIRLLAMHHLQRGLTTKDTAKIVGYPRQTIWEWVQWYERARPTGDASHCLRLLKKPLLKKRLSNCKMPDRGEELLAKILISISKPYGEFGSLREAFIRF